MVKNLEKKEKINISLLFFFSLAGIIFSFIQFDFFLVPLIHLIIFLGILLVTKEKTFIFSIFYFAINIGLFLVNFFIPNKELFFTSPIYLLFYGIFSTLFLILTFGGEIYEIYSRRKVNTGNFAVGKDL